MNLGKQNQSNHTNQSRPDERADFIVNPITRKKVHIWTTKGVAILRQYLVQYENYQKHTKSHK